jgi:hypothetical protein
MDPRYSIATTNIPLSIEPGPEQIRYENGDLAAFVIQGSHEIPLWYRVSSTCPDRRFGGRIFFGLWSPVPHGSCGSVMRALRHIDKGREARCFRLYVRLCLVEFRAEGLDSDDGDGRDNDTPMSTATHSLPDVASDDFGA